MDNKKIGIFIASLRKEQKLTQKQLAEKLFVSDKAVSKWERGLCMPDISLIENLARILSVSVSEILKGEKFVKINKKETDDIVKGSINYFQKKYLTKKLKKILTITTLVIIIGYLLILTIGEYNYGEISIKLIGGYGTMDVPSFSSKITHRRTKSFLKYLSEYNYYKIDELLMFNSDYEINPDHEYDYGWYLTLSSKAQSTDEYINNLKELKSLGFKITKYRLSSCRYDGCGYDVVFIYNDDSYEMTLYLATERKHILFVGTGWGTPTRFGSKYTIEDLRINDYAFYQKLEKLYIF